MYRYRYIFVPRCVSLMKPELLALPDRMIPYPAFGRIRVAQSLFSVSCFNSLPFLRLSIFSIVWFPRLIIFFERFEFNLRAVPSNSWNAEFWDFTKLRNRWCIPNRNKGNNFSKLCVLKGASYVWDVLLSKEDLFNAMSLHSGKTHSRTHYTNPCSVNYWWNFVSILHLKVNFILNFIINMQQKRGMFMIDIKQNTNLGVVVLSFITDIFNNKALSSLSSYIHLIKMMNWRWNKICTEDRCHLCL